jgi:hypothetical protein
MKIETDGTAQVDPDPGRKRAFERLGRPLSWPAYALLWKSYALIKEWSLRISPLLGGKLTWQRLKKVRPHHFKGVFQAIKRSLRIATENTTNPYE